PLVCACVECYRRRIHFVLRSRTVQEASRDLVTESTRSEMYANPDSALLIFEDVDVVIARSNRPKLRASDITQRRQPPRGAVSSLRDLPRVIVVVVEQLVIHLLFVLTSQTEADRGPDVIHDLGDIGTH